MSKENRRKIALFLIGVFFPFIGGILIGHVEDCGGLSSLYAHTNAKMIVDTHTLVSNNWEVFIAKYVSNRAWTTGMFMKEDIKVIIAECRQRELEKYFLADKRKNEGNGVRTFGCKLWLFALLMAGGIDVMVKEWWKKRCAAGNRPFGKWIYFIFRFVLCCLVCGALAVDFFRSIEKCVKSHTEHERVEKLFKEAGILEKTEW